MAAGYRFSFGPWNISEGADPFGPPIRPTMAFAEKLRLYRELGYEGIQFHDDDAVPDIDSKSPQQLADEAKATKKVLDDHGLVAEFAAPRLWEDPRGADGGFTSNDPKAREWAVERAKRTVDVCRALGTTFSVFWFAREGTSIREAKDATEAHKRLIDGVSQVLDYDPAMRIAIEPKPNEPMDHAYIPTVGHAVAMGQRTSAPDRMGVLIETAHSVLAGLDPSDDMAFALSMDKLWSVHLNDQNGLKFDQDKVFGSANLRSAFNQVRVLERAHYAETGRFVGVDVQAMRTQKPELAHKHLRNCIENFNLLVEKVRTFPTDTERQCIENRDYDELDRLVIRHLMGM